MLHLTEFTFKDGGTEHRGILIDVPKDGALYDVATELYTQHQDTLHPADLILLRPAVWAPWNTTRQKETRAPIKEISKRFPGVSVRVISSKNHEHVVEKNSDGSSPFQFDDNPQLFLDKLRSEELEQLVKRSEALYLTDQSSVFRHPSRFLSNAFLRVGNIQTSRGALDLLFFWLLPYLKGVEGILVDTWSISSIALNASRLLGRYERKNKTPIRFEMLDHYLDGRAETRKELEEIVRRVSGQFRKPFLILFSATMTGKSLEKFSSVLSTMHCPTELQKYLVLFRLGEDQIKVNETIIPELCDLSGEMPPRTEESGQTVRTAIEIDPTTYFPVFVHEENVYLTDGLAAKHNAFFNRYKGQKAIRIHENNYVDRQKFRHHGIYLDVSQMLKNDYFSGKFRRIIDELEPLPKVILVPPHDAGRHLAEIAADRLKEKTGQRPKIVEHLDLNISADASNNDRATNDMNRIHKRIKRFGRGSALLVLDDVMTTGSRILGYQKRLRELEFKGQIHYRIGVCRMSSAKDKKEIGKILRPNKFGGNHTLDFVENVILPNWDEQSCPLCVESRLLDQLIREKIVPSGSILLDRASQLRNSVDQGLVDGVFFGLPSIQPLQITLNSFFVKEGATQAVVLCSVAAAIQELRNHDDLSQRLNARGFPVRRTFAIENFDRYTDGILRASLLRCLNAVDLPKTAHQKDELIVDWARRIFCENSNDTQSTRPELLLAIGLHKIPIEVVDNDFKQSIACNDLLDLMPLIEAERNRLP